MAKIPTAASQYNTSLFYYGVGGDALFASQKNIFFQMNATDLESEINIGTENCSYSVGISI